MEAHFSLKNDFKEKYAGISTIPCKIKSIHTTSNPILYL